MATIRPPRLFLTNSDRSSPLKRALAAKLAQKSPTVKTTKADTK